MWGNLGQQIGGGLSEFARMRQEQPLRDAQIAESQARGGLYQAQGDRLRQQAGEEAAAAEGANRQQEAYASALQEHNGSVPFEVNVRIWGPDKAKVMADGEMAYLELSEQRSENLGGTLLRLATALDGMGPGPLRDAVYADAREKSIQLYNIPEESIPTEYSPDLLPLLRSSIDPTDRYKQQNPNAGVLDTITGEVAHAAPTPEKTPTSIDSAILLAESKGDSERVAELIALKGKVAAAGRAPSSGSSTQNRLNEIRLTREEAAFAREQTYDSMPNEIKNVANRVVMSIAKIRRGDFKENIADLYEQGNTEEIKSTIFQRALESEDVGTQRQVEGRRVAIRIMKSLREMVKEVPTSLVRGTWENTVQAIGKTSDPKLAEIGTRIMAAVFEYRHAMTGVQFSFQESRQYEGMFPNYKNEPPLNEAKIRGLMGDMDLRDREFWDIKAGKSGAEWLGAYAADQPATIKWYGGEDATASPVGLTYQQYLDSQR